MKFITGAYSDIGNYRETNQDSCCIMEADTGIGKVLMTIVCDGMGGLAKGEVASASVIYAFKEWFIKKFPTYLSGFSRDKVETYEEIEMWITTEWITLLHEIDWKMKEYQTKESIRIGTTFSGLMLLEQGGIWVHAGDSRIYKMGKDGIRKLTTDHTAAEREVRKGNLRPEEVPYSRLRSKLTQCIGATRELMPESGRIDIASGDVFLLCSDGFYHKPTNEWLYKEFYRKEHRTDRQLKEKCIENVKAVMEHGEKDNVTVVAVQVL